MSLAAAFRRAAERLSRGVVLKRKLPAAFGRRVIYVSPDAMLRLWRFDLQSVDPLLYSLASRFVRPGWVVWDLGANVGLFAFAAAAVAGPNGRVFAFEPDPFLQQLLLRSAAKTPPGHAPVGVVAAAVSDTVALSAFHIAGRGRARNHLGQVAPALTGPDRARQMVATVTLDWLLDHLPAPDLVKIDVEGFEHLVLAGGQRVLQSIRPTLILEVCGENRDCVTAVLRKFDYELFQPTVRDISPVAEAQWDTLAVPREAAASLR